MNTNYKFLVVVLLTLIHPALASATGPYQGTGIKICEVEPTRAIIWTRLTRIPLRVDDGHPLPIVLYKDPDSGELIPRSGRPDLEPVVQFPEGSDIDSIEGAVPGMAGEVRIRYRDDQAGAWQATAWRAVDPQKDFTRQVLLTGLKPGTRYRLEVQSRTADGEGESLNGQFSTAPAADTPAPVAFTVTTGQAYPDQDCPSGYRIYPAMLKNDPDFFVHTGDILYYDSLGKTLELARWHWARMYSLPTNLTFHKQVPSYFMKDDHDTWMNDCWSTLDTRFMGEFTFTQGLEVFREQVGMGDKTYRTFRWGKDLQVWLVEGRDFRSPNNMPDGPDKTIWGEEQKEWFKRTVRESDATFRVLISPTPVIGPDRTNKSDNHSNATFTHEGDEIRDFLASQENMYVVCGDRHWQYVSAGARTGIMEFSCGPASDAHAGGWSNDMLYPEHRYLNVTGGWLEGAVEYDQETPVLYFRHYGVDGQLLNEERLPTRES